MVKNSIEIYARLKQEYQGKSTKYEIGKSENSEILTFRCNHAGKITISNSFNHRHRKYFETKSSDFCLKNYRFEKVFDQNSTQSEVFDTIAKPVVHSVVQGFNGTIFAYGQTGSGKTYAITGSSTDYLERGIIPRSIEEVFGCIKKAPDKYTVYISYLEIYNESGYDLLTPKPPILHLEELPRIVLLEDGKGKFHIRNLTVRRVSSEQEAMRLLLLGDANRTITETPMNVYSSRSHCIFTIFINSRITNSGKLRRSKLNLVDLAGSERVYKSDISGSTLNEAKYINLSLHYLEQVILALSQKKPHIPFRNSMLTYVLKDSLSGNCKTVLLATLSLNKNNIEETLATCKFAQRVGEVDMEAIVNDEVDPQQEIDCLKTEIEALRKQLLQQSKFKISGNLTKEEKQQWKNIINNYLDDTKDEIPLTNFDMRLIKYSFKLLKDAVKSREEQKTKLKSIETNNQELIQQYKSVINQKENEITTLKHLLGGNVKMQPEHSPSFSCTESETSSFASYLERKKENIPPNADALALSPGQKVAFEVFMKDSKNTTELDYYTEAIQEMFDIAKKITLVVEQCQNNILAVRAKYRHSSMSRDLDLELQDQQNRYRSSLQKLHDLKDKTEKLTKGLENAKMKVLLRFKQWYENLSRSDVADSKYNDIITCQNSAPDNFKSNPSLESKKFEININKMEDHNRPQSPIKYPIRHMDESPTRSGTEEEESCISDDCRSGVHRPKTPSRIPRPNKKLKNVSKEISGRQNVNSKDDGINRPENLKDDSFINNLINTVHKVEDKRDELMDSSNANQNGLITPPNSETRNSDDFSSAVAETPYYQTPIGVFYEANKNMSSPFRPEPYNAKELPEKEESIFSSAKKNIQDENRCKLVDLTDFIGKVRSPHKHSHHICKTSEKSDSTEEKPQCKEAIFQNTLKGPQKPEHLKCTTSADSPRTALSDSRKFVSVYKMIMGYDTDDKVSMLRPYSADSPPKTQFLLQERDNPKHRYGVNHTFGPRSPLRSARRYHSSYCRDHNIEKSKVLNIPENSFDENAEEQDTTDSLWRERRIFADRKHQTPYYGVTFQNSVSADIARSVTPGREHQINAKHLGLYPSRLDYPCLHSRNINHTSSPIRNEYGKSFAQTYQANLFNPKDSLEFRNFISTIPLTGDFDVDEEIVKFYRSKFL